LKRNRNSRKEKDLREEEAEGEEKRREEKDRDRKREKWKRQGRILSRLGLKIVARIREPMKRLRYFLFKGRFEILILRIKIYLMGQFSKWMPFGKEN